MKKPNRVAEAFKEGFNMVGLGGAVALSAALLNPLPLIVGLVAEAAYLLFVPDSKWYLSRLSKRDDAAVAARRADLKARVFPEIAESTRKRFERLEGIRAQLGAQADLDDQDWFRQVVRRLDYLLEKFLLFARKETQFRDYLGSVLDEVRTAQGRGHGAVERDDEGRVIVNDRRASRKGKRGGDGDADAPPPISGDRIVETVEFIQDHYDGEIATLTERRAAEEDRNTQAVLEKRGDVLTQRREYVGKIGKILTNLRHQMDLLEDSFGLINDQVRARPPEQVLADIEGVVYQTDSMTKLLEELAPYDGG
jgi:hypothetical protein